MKEELEEETRVLPNNFFDKTMRMVLQKKSEAVYFINKSLKLDGIHELKEEDIENYTTAFVNKGMENRTADIIYKVINEEKTEGEVYFLIEHQSKVDNSMPLRILEYEEEIIRISVDREKVKNKDYKIPLIIPIILYTGKEKWTVEKCIEDKQSKLKGYEHKRFAEMIVKDAKEYDEEELLNNESILSKILLIENKKSAEELEEVYNKVIGNIKGKEKKEIFKIYSRMTLETLFGKEKAEEMIKKLKEEEEDGNHMLVEALREDIEKKTIAAKNEGKLEGRAEGRAQGRKEEKIKLVKAMLKEKVDIEFISRITGLSKQEIKTVKVS